MTAKQKQDIRIKINFTQKDGEPDAIFLEEFDSTTYLKQIAQISKRVVLQDTADVIFRMFAKTAKKEAKLDEISTKLPCLKATYLPAFTEFFNRQDISYILHAYNNASDKKLKRELRNKISQLLVPLVEQTVDYDDLYFNFSKFKFLYDRDKLNQTRQARVMIKAMDMGYDHHDKFLLAVLQMYEDNIVKRTEEPRKAYWMLIKDANGNVIGMTFISSKRLHDDLIGKDIVGHSGQILDPSVQGQGYVSIIKSVMADFMYDTMDDRTAQETLFATTCNEFNENSQGLQYKSGAKPLTNKNGAIIVTGGKIHWYATKDDIMGSDIMQQCIERGISYEVTPGHYVTGRNAYSKTLGESKHVSLNNQFIKEENYVRE